MKLLFIPDVHLQEYSPRSRKDNYPSVILDKLNWIANYANSIDATTYFLGDLFNATNLPMIYFYRVVEVFKKFNKMPHIIIGNHDMLHLKEELMSRTPLGLLEQIGLINYFGSNHGGSIVPDVEIRGFHYMEPVQKTTSKAPVRICMAHAFYEDNFATEHNLHIKDCLDLNYTHYILGHDHTPYEDVVNDSYTVIRPGSLSRGTANDKQLTRNTINIIEFDTDTKEFKKVPVPCQEAHEVFKDTVFLRKEETKLDTAKVLDQLVFTSNDSIYDVLDRAEQTDEIKKIVEEYLQAAGIFRENLK